MTSRERAIEIFLKACDWKESRALFDKMIEEVPSTRKMIAELTAGIERDRIHQAGKRIAKMVLEPPKDSR